MLFNFHELKADLIVPLLSLSIIGISMASIAGFLGRIWWPFDLFSHFRAQYLALLVIFSGSALLLGSAPISVLGGAFALINLLTIAPYYFPESRLPANKKIARILLSNVLRPNTQHSKLRQFIQVAHPDIIILIEISDRWLEALDPVLFDYPHRYAAMRSDNYGIAIFSRFALNNAETLYFSDAGVPSLIADISLDGHHLTLIATHPPPPKTKTENNFRNQQIENLTSFISTHQKATILLGDLNTTSWSPYFRDLIRKSGLRDSRKGFGIQPTWPADKPVLMVPIDHILVSDQIGILDRFTGPNIGSDHRPVILDFSLKN